MSGYAADDDSLEAEEYRSYADLCPPKLDLGTFVEMSKRFINDFKTGGDAATVKEINRQLSTLQAAIKKLSPTAQAVLRAREHDHWQSARPDGALYDDEWLRRAEQVGNGGAALAILRKTSEGKFTRRKWPAVNRTMLIGRAVWLFKEGAEDIAVGNGRLVRYIQHLLGAVGLEDGHPKKALRDFLAKHGVETVNTTPRKVYRLR